MGGEMMLTIEAVFDGKAFFPVNPLSIKPNTRVKLSVILEDGKPVSFLDVAQSLRLEGPPDWSTNLDEYLYGSIKA